MSYVIQKLGTCAVCGGRVYSDQEYVKSAEGYCCEECIKDRKNVVTA